MNQRLTIDQILAALLPALREKLAHYPDFGSIGFEMAIHQGQVVQTEWRIRQKSATAIDLGDINRVPLDTKKKVVVVRRSSENGQ